MNLTFNGIILYARDIEQTADFYQTYFGFTVALNDLPYEIELKPPAGHTSIAGTGTHIRILKADKSIKMGQVLIKLVFTVDDVEQFKVQALAKGLKFGSTHKTDGYSFANVKDPNGNNVSISSRGS